MITQRLTISFLVRLERVTPSAIGMMVVQVVIGIDIVYVKEDTEIRITVTIVL